MIKKRAKKNESYVKLIQALKNYRFTKKRIEILFKLRDEVQEYKTRGIKNVCTDGIKITACSGDKVGNDVVKVSAMEESILVELRKKKHEVYLIENAMAILDEIERDVIEMKYIDKIAGYKIESALGYEKSTINRYKNNGIEKMIKVMFG